MLQIPSWRRPRPAFDTILGTLAALTLFSGAVETPLYVAFGIPPVLGAPFMALAGIAGAIALVRLVPKFPAAPAIMIPLGLWFSFLIWAALSAAWSTATGIVTAKLALLGVSGCFLVLGICVGFAEDAFASFIVSLFAFGLATAIAIFLFANSGTPHAAQAAQAFKAFEASYQATTQCVALAAVAALAHLLADTRNRASALAWGAGWIVLTFATLAGGGRGAAIGGALAQLSVLGFAMFVFWRKDGSGRLLAALLATPLLFAAVLAAGSLLQFRGLIRLLGIVNSAFDKTDRLELWSAALKMADAHPVFGAGLASFHASANNLEMLGLYPHNVFLELLAETGLIGFALFVAAFACACIALARLARSVPFIQGAFWLGLFVYTMFEMNVLDSMTGRNIAFVLGLSAGLAARFYRPARSENPSPPLQSQAPVRTEAHTSRA